jgi:type IV secretory pathway VirD2 relaxase
MAEQRNDMFRVKPRPPRSGARTTERSFLSRVAMEMGKVGGPHGVALRGVRGRGAKRGRGWVAARLMDTNTGPHARRVVVKTHLVVFKQAGRRSAAMHLRYIVRDGVGRDGERGQAYSAGSDAADVKAFEERSHGDRHQFRFIVAPEDAVELENLRDFTRDFMSRMERDLGTRLEWVAVDHWDTDNPHTHVVLRGKDQAGENLVIGREYISHGMRLRAGELATEWLGPRLEREIQASLRRDVSQERLTALDRTLRGLDQVGGVVGLTGPAERLGGLQRRALLIGRLHRLETLGLARELDAGRWQLRPDTEAVLQRLGERNDIIRTMQRALGNERRECSIGVEAGASVSGRIAAKGLAEEQHDQPYLVIDGLDGRAHYVALPKTHDLAELPIGGIVEVRPMRESVADRTIASMAQEGHYLARTHVHELRVKGASTNRAHEIVDGHVRRLEALRRAGIVQRVADGFWAVPADLVERGRAYDLKRSGGVAVELQSHLSIDKQVRTIGATWLDRKLVDGGASTLTVGFGAAARQAIIERVDFLAEQGLAERRGNRAHVAPKLLSTLRDREIHRVAQNIQQQTGLPYRPTAEGVRVSGTYRQSVTLASGRFAMLSDGLGFSLVPWRPAIEPALGRTVTAIVRDGQAMWDLGRQRGISR